MFYMEYLERDASLNLWENWVFCDEIEVSIEIYFQWDEA